MERLIVSLLLGSLVLGVTASSAQDAGNFQKQIDDVKSALPKFAIPMREVGRSFSEHVLRGRIQAQAFGGLEAAKNKGSLAIGTPCMKLTRPGRQLR